MTEKKLKHGRFITEKGDSTLESDIEAAKVHTLNSFGARIEENRKRANKLKEKIARTKLRADEEL